MAPSAAYLPVADLIYDWNQVGRTGRPVPRGLSLFDGTLARQFPKGSLSDFRIDTKLELLHHMATIGIGVADVGSPASSSGSFEDILRMCREISEARLCIQVACTLRSPSDVASIARISQCAGLSVEVYTSGGSPLFQESADERLTFGLSADSTSLIDAAVKEGLQVAYIAEDATSSPPEGLALQFKVALDHGVSRLCLSDTKGKATPDGVRSLVEFTKSIVTNASTTAGIDWCGQNGRGLALENALWAIELGADRVHGTALGLGGDTGSAPMELILLNAKLMGLLGDQTLEHLIEYCNVATTASHYQVPLNYPLAGRDAFRTATGVHAAAIMKAEAKGTAWLADRIYSGVPAGMLGRRQEICVGYMSGASNVMHWLRQQKIEPSSAIVEAILLKAKVMNRILVDEEIWALVNEVRLLG